VTSSYSAFKTAIQTEPINVTFYVTSSFYSYTSGIYSGTDCGTTTSSNLNHAMQAIGYGVQNGVEYAIIKNQWSTSWGNAGYVYVQLTTDNVGVCGLYLNNYYTTYGF